jgi:hypothetical protein
VLAKMAIFYFAGVFGAGFVFGSIRVLWIVPKLGVRTAELLEMPFMIGVTVLMALWTIRRYSVPPSLRDRLRIGFLGLLFMIAAEVGLAAAIRGISVQEYWTSRDPVSGTAYLIALAVFAMMPALLSGSVSAKPHRKERTV